MKTRRVTKDGITVIYSNLHPKGLTTAMLPPLPSCPIELRAQLRETREELAKARQRARWLYHKKLVWERKLSEVTPSKSLSDAA